MEKISNYWPALKRGTMANHQRTRAAGLPLAIDHFRYFAGVIRARRGSGFRTRQQYPCRWLFTNLGVVGQIMPEFSAVDGSLENSTNWQRQLCCTQSRQSRHRGHHGIGWNHWRHPSRRRTQYCQRLWRWNRQTISIQSRINKGALPEEQPPVSSSCNMPLKHYTGNHGTGRINHPTYFLKTSWMPMMNFRQMHWKGLPFTLNQGGFAPSVQDTCRKIHLRYLHWRFLERVKQVKIGHPTDPEPWWVHRHQASSTIRSCVILSWAKDEGAQLLTGGCGAYNEGLEGGYYIKPTVFKGNNQMRIFQEEIFWSRSVYCYLQDRRRSHSHCQWYPLWTGSRCMDARHAYYI